MIVPSKNQKTYGVLHTENYFSFLGFCKKVNSDEIQKVDVYLDDVLIDTIIADKHLQKIENIYELDSFGFTYNLPEKYIGQKSLISFKNHESQENLQNSPYSLVDTAHPKFNETKFIYSLNEPIGEELRNMYKPNSVGFLATKVNLEDEEFVEYINQIMNDFPEYDFKAFYFDKNSIKEIKEKFRNSNLKLIELTDVKDIFENLEVYISNYEKTFRDSYEIGIMNILRYKSNDIPVLTLNLNRAKNLTLYEFENQNKIYFQKLLDNIEYLGFNKHDIQKYDNNFNAINFNSSSEKYGVNINFNLDELMRKAYIYYHLKIGYTNHNYFKEIIDRVKKSIELQNR
jgi:hypothetical protein